jgi:L-2-hydroxyglutarate oxidase LhgO
MLKEYCSLKSLPFKQDGVLEVATYDKAIDRLHKYLEWGYSNGLQKNEIQFLEKNEVQNLELNVRCLAGVYCSRDASIDYGVVTTELMEDARRLGCMLLCQEYLEIRAIHIRRFMAAIRDTATKDRARARGIIIGGTIQTRYGSKDRHRIYRSTGREIRLA